MRTWPRLHHPFLLRVPLTTWQRLKDCAVERRLPITRVILEFINVGVSPPLPVNSGNTEETTALPWNDNAQQEEKP